MSMWTLEEREEINKTLQYEAELATIAWKAYEEAKNTNQLLKIVLLKPEYKSLTDYYTFDQIVDDVLKYR